jgi:predicted AlkP superfamily pyrophosphatase or phosphodiesterase
MESEPSSSPVVPAFGAASLPDLAESLLASVTGQGTNILGLPPTRRTCLLIIDGLGWEALRDRQAAAPFLSELAFNGTTLSCGFPSTTVTSLGSLGTGRAPGEHGMLGYRVAVPGTDTLLNGLRWDSGIDPAAWQPLPTIFERAEAAGVPASRVAWESLDQTGLSRAAFRGARFRRANSMGALAAEAAAALHETERALVTVYHGDLDSAGHDYGTLSDAWGFQLSHVDKLLEQIVGAMPSDTVLYVTADHGMVTVPEQDRLDADRIPELSEGVAMLGGDARARYVYARPGAAGDVLATWREVLGDRAWVLSRDEAIKDGWFGTVAPEMIPRIGDVVAAMAGTNAVVATSAEPKESAMTGMHGSLTHAEQLVPLLTFSTS